MGPAHGNPCKCIDTRSDAWGLAGTAGDAGPGPRGRPGGGTAACLLPGPGTSPSFSHACRFTSHRLKDVYGADTGDGVHVGASEDKGSGTPGACPAVQGRAHCGGRSGDAVPGNIRPALRTPKPAQTTRRVLAPESCPPACLGPALAPPGPWRSPWETCPRRAQTLTPTSELPPFPEPWASARELG